MNHKHIFYAALTCRLTSFVSLGVFLFVIFKDLGDKLALMTLGISFAAWVLSTAFVHFYKEAVAKQIIAMMVARESAIESLVDEEEDVKAKYPNHPIFGEIEENQEDQNE